MKFETAILALGFIQAHRGTQRGDYTWEMRMSAVEDLILDSSRFDMRSCLLKFAVVQRLYFLSLQATLPVQGHRRR